LKFNTSDHYLLLLLNFGDLCLGSGNEFFDWKKKMAVWAPVPLKTLGFLIWGAGFGPVGRK